MRSRLIRDFGEFGPSFPHLNPLSAPPGREPGARKKRGNACGGAETNVTDPGYNWTEPPPWINNADSLMIGPAKIYFIVFGVLTILGGVMGYVKAASTISLVAGGITGVLLLAAGFLLPDHAMAGLILALVTSLLLAGQFAPKFIRTGKAMPAGMMTILSVIGIIMAVVAWIRK